MPKYGIINKFYIYIKKIIIYKIINNRNNHKIMNTKDLIWYDNFRYDNMVAIDVPGDGSCLFHVISMAIYKPYQKNQFDRIKFVRELRRKLSVKLPIYYDKLADGKLLDLSIDIPEVNLENMQKELDSARYLSNIYNEYISELLDIDIYILSEKNKDIYPTGTDFRLIYKNRLSIVILYIDSKKHYQLIGIKDYNGDITVSFDHNNDFIEYVKSRYRKKINI